MRAPAPLSPDVDARPKATPNHVTIPALSSCILPHKRHPKAGPIAIGRVHMGGRMGCTRARGRTKPHRERGSQKEGAASRASEEAARYTNRPNPLPVSATNRDETGREPRPKTNTKTIDSRCSIHA
ncbi:hypothetical protein FJTKL_09443 [Diaporthe vaccinii]|uniref:Uncharacterized protein n=1 Tax=Diaporthe vaccinii TaxID=105482 RepID=A0ABR4FCP5_9PEZI